MLAIAHTKKGTRNKETGRVREYQRDTTGLWLVLGIGSYWYCHVLIHTV